jgi:hypothetical protein
VARSGSLCGGRSPPSATTSPRWLDAAGRPGYQPVVLPFDDDAIVGDQLRASIDQA